MSTDDWTPLTESETAGWPDCAKGAETVCRPERVTCTESNDVRPGLRPVASLTNYVGGEVLDPRLPPRTETTWGRDDGTEVLRDELDADGCRHYLLTDQ